jgi:putative ABC transport system substrate-binding protein
MRKLGWIEGQNVIHEDRWTTDPAMLHQYAKELVELNVEIIVTVGTAATLAAKAATSRIPIVMYSSGDPVRVGLVQSLSRPGGNITGYTVLGPELDTKRLEIVREILPEVQRIGVLHNPSNPYYELTRVETERMYRSFNVRAIVIGVKGVGEVENAVAEAVRQRAQALLVSADLDFDLPALVDAAMKHSLPTIADDRELVRTGCLLSLSPDPSDQSRAFAYVMDRILRGAKPADIPIQQPRTLLLVVNLQTARALGLTIPKELLLRADEVIQ